MSIDTKDVIYLRWTESAYECYSRNCVCEGCENRWYCTTYGKNNPYQIPQMKYTILKLWENLGEEGLRRFERRKLKKKKERCDK